MFLKKNLIPLLWLSKRSYSKCLLEEWFHMQFANCPAHRGVLRATFSLISFNFMGTLFEIKHFLCRAEQEKWFPQFDINLPQRRRKFCRLSRNGDKIWLLVIALSDLQGQSKVVCFQLLTGGISPWRNIKESFVIAQITLILIYLEQFQLCYWRLQCNTPMYPSCSNGSLHILAEYGYSG